MQTQIEGKLVMIDGEMSMGPPEWSRAFRPGIVSGYCMIRHSDASIFIYDVTNRATFEDLEGYHKDYIEQRSLVMTTGRSSQPHSPFQAPSLGALFVIANKIDHDRSDWEVSIQEGENLSVALEAMFLQMSAKTGDGASEAVLKDIVGHVLLRKIRDIGKSDDEFHGNAGPRRAGPLDNVLQGPFWSELRRREESPLNDHRTS